MLLVFAFARTLYNWAILFTFLGVWHFASVWNTTTWWHWTSHYDILWPCRHLGPGQSHLRGGGRTNIWDHSERRGLIGQLLLWQKRNTLRQTGIILHLNLYLFLDVNSIIWFPILTISSVLRFAKLCILNPLPVMSIWLPFDLSINTTSNF